jgi:hypothetical protein
MLSGEYMTVSVVFVKFGDIDNEKDRIKQQIIKQYDGNLMSENELADRLSKLKEYTKCMKLNLDNMQNLIE